MRTVFICTTALLLAVALAACRTERPAPAATAAEASSSIEKEYQKLLDDDDAARAEVDKWIQDQTTNTVQSELNMRIRSRLDPVRRGYEDFLGRHPDHARARTAYGSFLGEIHDEEGSQEQFERALQSDTNSPAIYNNLANIYGHRGSVKKAFEFYAKAIELNPTESVYYENFGTTVYLFRPDAREFYGITEQQVFDKAMALYSNAMRFDPTNFTLASDVAQSYYAIKPWRFEDALQSWTNAFHLAHDELEREGVHIHFARVKIQAGRFDEARQHLNTITNEMYAQLKQRLTRVLSEKEAPATSTNAPPAQPDK